MCARIKSPDLMSSPKQLNACLFAASLLLAACAHTPQKPDSALATSAENAAQNEADDAPEVLPAPAPASAAVLPRQELTSEWLYEYLVSEIGNQRGYQSLAVNGSSDLAMKTRDPRLARRAAQLAFESGDMEKSVTAFKLWQELEPDATLPTRMLASILMRGGKLQQSQAEFAKVLKGDEANASHDFLQIQQLLLSYPDKTAALTMMRELAAPYPKVAEAHLSVTQVARAAGDNALALSEIKQARSLRPEWDAAAGIEAELLQKSAPQQGLQVLKAFLDKYPNAHELRLQYARALVEQQQFPEARVQFQRVADNTPDNPDLAFAIALLSLQMNDLQGAEAQLKLALNKGKKDQDRVQYYLGQLSEAKKQDEEAIAYYRAVKAGEHEFAANMRVVVLLNRQGKLDEARQALHSYVPSSNDQRAQVVLIETQLLRDAKQYEQAYRVLQQGLEKLPNHTVLLYEYAMLADKIGKYERAEQSLRKLMQLNPQDANAYNALGYSLLERNERVPEAVTLVEKALQLAPDDVSIMDSVGWGYYRSGKLDESVAMLRRAYAGNPDPEIASHLIEVLWVRGEKEEALRLLNSSLKAHPDSEPLQTVGKKIHP